MFVSVSTNHGINAKRFKARKHYLPKGIIKNYNMIVNGKKIYEQPIDSDIKRYEKFKRLTTRQGVDYSNGCLYDFEYIKNHYRLITIDLRRQKELDSDPKQI